MMILLGILKWIGIVLLALLILLLLIALVLLFAPIRYRLAGEKGAELRGFFDVSWIFGAVRAEGSYTPADALQCRVKLLWFTVIGGEKKKKREKQPKREPTPQPDIVATEKTTAPDALPAEKPPQEDAAPQEQARQEETLPKQAEPKARKRPSMQQMERMQPKTMRRVKLSELADEPPQEDFAEDIPDLEDEAFFSDEPQEGERKGIKDRLAAIRQTASEIEDKKGIAQALARLLKRLIRGILPRGLFLKGTFGTGDPVTTGYLLALAGILTAKFGEDIQVSGDFTKECAEDIEVRVQGRIILGGLLWALAAFLLTKPVRRCIAYLWKKRKAKEGQGEANE